MDILLRIDGGASTDLEAHSGETHSKEGGSGRSSTEPSPQSASSVLVGSGGEEHQVELYARKNIPENNRYQTFDKVEKYHSVLCIFSRDNHPDEYVDTVTSFQEIALRKMVRNHKFIETDFSKKLGAELKHDLDVREQARQDFSPKDWKSQLSSTYSQLKTPLMRDVVVRDFCVRVYELANLSPDEDEAKSLKLDAERLFEVIKEKPVSIGLTEGLEAGNRVLLSLYPKLFK